MSESVNLNFNVASSIWPSESFNQSQFWSVAGVEITSETGFKIISNHWSGVRNRNPHCVRNLAIHRAGGLIRFRFFVARFKMSEGRVCFGYLIEILNRSGNILFQIITVLLLGIVFYPLVLSEITLVAHLSHCMLK